MRISLFLLAALTLTGVSLGQELSGHVELEARAFPEGALLSEQHVTNASLAIQLELFGEWDDRSQRVVVTPFVRVDLRDERRTHVDLRDGYWRYLADTWDVRVGFARVFWGVAESQHLVDVINQTDGVENPDGEDKLGQPMVQWTWLSTRGTLDLLVMPFFRERTFPGEDGRLRFPLPIDTDPTIRHERVDLAARWSRAIRRFDVGIAHFWGTSREPRFALRGQGGDSVLLPVYETIHQTSLDAQATIGSWALKAEALTRSGQGDRLYAVVSGFEYTLGNVRNTGYDLGLLAEYHYDSREAVELSAVGRPPSQSASPDGPSGVQPISITPFNDDVFVGARLAMNDVKSSEVLGGAIVDRTTRSTAFFLEASRRVARQLTLDVEVRGFVNAHPKDPLYSYRDDSFIQATVGYHF